MSKHVAELGGRVDGAAALGDLPGDAGVGPAHALDGAVLSLALVGETGAVVFGLSGG
ncbi:hypothetical protein [Microbacterium sp.]|uniref:hypothetical protein n=1 Tax=Microbacterium sp. TaxID=51671 RepID=UPI0031FEA2D0